MKLGVCVVTCRLENTDIIQMKTEFVWIAFESYQASHKKQQILKKKKLNFIYQIQIPEKYWVP